MSLVLERAVWRLIDVAARIREELPAMLADLAFMNSYILPIEWPDDIDHRVR